MGSGRTSGARPSERQVTGHEGDGDESVLEGDPGATLHLCPLFQ